MDATGHYMACTPKRLPKELHYHAALAAIKYNPLNAAPVQRLVGAGVMPAEYISVLTTKYWGSGGVHLTVSFMESFAAAIQTKILAHMNAWGQRCNVSFSRVASGGQVRISVGGGGYWSYLGTDVLQIPGNEQTMNLEGFDNPSTPESEFYRVVRHECGHTLGAPHEHMRGEIIARINKQKAIAFFMSTQGWSQQEVIQQVLTPLEESSLMGTPHADQTSIMCYQLGANLTNDGLPILGGNDINELDYSFMASIYPKAVTPPPPVVNPGTPPPTGTPAGFTGKATGLLSIPVGVGGHNVAKVPVDLDIKLKAD